MKSSRVRKQLREMISNSVNEDNIKANVVAVEENNDLQHVAKKRRKNKDVSDVIDNDDKPASVTLLLDTKLVETSVLATQTFVREAKKPDACPSARWGHAWCMINDSETVMIGGQGDRNVLCKDAVWQLDLVARKWSVPEMQVTSMKPEARTGHSVVYNPMARCMYVFGGSKNKKWFSDVHMVDTDTWTWQCVQANGSAPTRAYHSCTLYGHEMWIFGGVFPRPDPQPDGCSNDIYVFSLYEEMWYMPLVMGTKPCPRSGHSATLFQNRLVVFGGWDAPVCFNDVYILDLSLVEWLKPDVKGTPPSPRSWHSSCALSGSRLYVHGGYNGNNALSDSFIFDLDTLTWTEVTIDPPIMARTGHAALCQPSRYETRDVDNVLLFGGGDNEGAFFNDLYGISIPTKENNVDKTPAAEHTEADT